MASKWRWNSIDLWIYDENVSRTIKRVELQVINSTTSTFQYIGATSRHFKMKGKVIGEANRDSLLSDAISNQARTLTTPWGTIPSLKIHGEPKFSTVNYAGGELGGVSYTADVTPIYDFEWELIDVG